MSGRIVASLIVLSALVAGIAIYYLQVFYYYEETTLPADRIVLTLPGGGTAPLPASGIEAIDAGSSPIRFRACFDTPATPESLMESAVEYPAADPLNAPYWFGCFDATEIGRALEAGTARAFLGQGNIHHGVDRVIAVTDTGRGYIWHQVNGDIRQ
ncbi:DUF6446 family protein [Tropicimonas sp.]|uniref:DUF6446 family protein n=1 Tax=Tropicimonas sp. TaxID=2067044 RepID=UPI003A876497